MCWNGSVNGFYIVAGSGTGCNPDEMKVLGVDLDLELMQNHTSEDFFEAIATPPPSPDSSSQIIKSEYEMNTTLPTEAKVVRIGNYSP